MAYHVFIMFDMEAGLAYQESKSAVSMGSGVVIFLVYFGIVLGRYQGLPIEVVGDTDAMLRFWAKAMLIYIPITVAVRIVLMILFTIVYRIAEGEDPPEFEDERDKLIELKVGRVGQAIFMLGFVGAMVPIVVGMSVSAMFLVLVISGVISEVVQETARIVMYRRGV